MPGFMILFTSSNAPAAIEPAILVFSNASLKFSASLGGKYTVCGSSYASVKPEIDSQTFCCESITVSVEVPGVTNLLSKIFHACQKGPKSTSSPSLTPLSNKPPSENLFRTPAT